ncbi:MAG: SDR family oxidoreductase [Spongiibacteraceae bacterium]
MYTNDLLVGEVAFISGGTSGINLGVAKVLSCYGAKVCILGRDADKANSAAQEIRDLTGGQVLAVTGDVRDYDAVEMALRQAKESLGELSIVIAGAAGNFFAPAVSINPKGFKAVVDIDLLGTYHVFRAGYDYCRQPGSSFIAITAPQAVNPTPLQAHVCAAKAGVNALLKTLAMEWGAAGIRVNGICPGLIDETEGLKKLLAVAPDQLEKMLEQLPLRQFGRVGDIGNAAVFLSSAAGSYATGTVIDIDGGYQLGSAVGDFLTPAR